MSRWHPTPAFLPGKSHGWRSLVGRSPWGRWESDMTEWLHFHFHALEKEMATHSRVLALRIPGMGEPGGLLSMRSNRVGHNWSDLAAAAAERYLVGVLISISSSRKMNLALFIAFRLCENLLNFYSFLYNVFFIFFSEFEETSPATPPTPHHHHQQY